MMLWFIFNCKIHPEFIMAVIIMLEDSHLRFKISSHLLLKPPINKTQKAKTYTS